jgi:hypothetical protein
MIRMVFSENRRILHHVIIPAFLVALFLLAVSTPVEVIGCRNRGLIAVTMALVGALSALGAVIKGLMGRIRGDSSSIWWVTSALILMIPALIVVIIA